VPVADGDCLVRNPQRVTYSYEHHPLRAATTHNARHQRAPDSQCLFASVPKIRGSLIGKSGDFPVEFDEGDGLKDRRLAACKMSISQVLISRTLSVCGEVAERLKAAVC
jgi:hypothetical protein